MCARAGVCVCFSRAAEGTNADTHVSIFTQGAAQREKGQSDKES